MLSSKPCVGSLGSVESCSSAAEAPSLEEQVEHFRAARESHAQRSYNGIIKAATRLLGTGLLVLLAGRIVARRHGAVGLSVATLGVCCIVTAMVFASTCHDEQELDMDGSMTEAPKTRVALGCTFMALGGYYAATRSPHVHALAALNGLCIVLGSQRLSLNMGPVQHVSLGVASFMLGDGAHYVHQAQQAKSDTLYVTYFACASIQFLAALVMNIYLQLLWRQGTSNSRHRAFFGNVFISCVFRFLCFTTLSFGNLFHGAGWLYFAAQLAEGLAWLCPIMLLLVLGPHRTFQLAANIIYSADRLQQDGAFIAALLDSVDVAVGMVWWVHRKDEDTRWDYPIEDPRRHWQQGFIEHVDAECFHVRVAVEQPRRRSRVSLTGLLGAAGGALPAAEGEMKRKEPIVIVQRGQHRMPSTELLAKARRDLRCVPWERLSRDIFESSSCPASESLELSASVPPDISVDLFLSHSWRDDADAKWAALCRAAESFHKRRGRCPTVWLDKLCIDQDSITDGLRSLSVSLMACDALLLLFGPHYTSRLWCIWELFTLTAFLPMERALARIQVAPLNGSELGRDGLSLQLEGFDVAASLTYDPNERLKLLAVIDAVGRARFNETIHELGQRIRTTEPSGVSSLSSISWRRTLSRSFSGASARLSAAKTMRTMSNLSALEQQDPVSTMPTDPSAEPNLAALEQDPEPAMPDFEDVGFSHAIDEIFLAHCTISLETPRGEDPEPHTPRC